MRFIETELEGCLVIELDEIEDERGSLVRTYCQDEFSRHGIKDRFVQCNSVTNRKKHTLRGLHFSISPAKESKLIRCLRGKIFDVLVDLRKESPDFMKWQGFELTDDRAVVLYVPSYIAHGYVTLEDNCQIFYQMGDFYSPDCYKGIRFDDPDIGIDWPVEPNMISEKDLNLPHLSQLQSILDSK